MLDQGAVIVRLDTDFPVQPCFLKVPGYTAAITVCHNVYTSGGEQTTTIIVF